jgi:hypothetical protein
METRLGLRIATVPLLAACLLLVPGAALARDLGHAVSLLEQARQHLKSAKHDKGGYRKRAMDRIDDAVAAIRMEQQHHTERRDEQHRGGDDDHGRNRGKHEHNDDDRSRDN